MSGWVGGWRNGCESLTLTLSTRHTLIGCAIIILYQGSPLTEQFLSNLKGTLFGPGRIDKT